VTATTELIRGVPRVRVNVAYTAALERVGLVPLVIPPLSAALASVILDGLAGLVVTGGEDVAPARYGEPAHPTVEVHEGRDESEIALIIDARRRRLVWTAAGIRGRGDAARESERRRGGDGNQTRGPIPGRKTRR